MFEPFAQVVGNRHEYAKNWKTKTGSKVIGTFCTYVPEEIIYAADMLPVRVMGSHEVQGLSEPYIPAMYCPYSRDVLNQAILGRYDYLDGIVKARSCHHLRQSFSNWVTYFPTEYWYYLFMPAEAASPRSHPTLVRWLELFKRSLEDWRGEPISDADLWKGVELVNTNRSLMRQVYELRRGDPPLLSGVEAKLMVMASQYMHKEEHSRLLQDILQRLPGRQDHPQGERPRLIMVGSCDDYTEIVDLIEKSGANVVIDEECTGTRYFWNNVNPDGDPLSAIATRYLERPPCPQKDFPHRRRFDHIMQLVKDYNVQ